jgi:hypothetical protein
MGIGSRHRRGLVAEQRGELRRDMADTLRRLEGNEREER